MSRPLRFCLASALALLLFSTATPATSADGGPNLASVNAAIGPLNGDAVRFGKHADRVVPIASITKLMMAMVVLDSGEPLDEWLTIRERDYEVNRNAYSRMRIGSELTRGDLLRIALMSSENLASDVLAMHHPGGRHAFVRAMNEKAMELGMNSSRFVDPHGLSEENIASAADLLTMVRAAHRYPTIREYSTTPGFQARFRSPRYDLQYGNTNALVHAGSWGVTLSKTGYINEAGRCLVMVATIDGQATAMVFLDSFGSRTPLGDASRARQWLRTGERGSVAGAALDYERSRTASIRERSIVSSAEYKESL